MAALSTSPEHSTLSSAQIDAVALLAAGKPIVAVAKHVGVHRATIHNWLKLPEFRAALEEARCDHLARIENNLREISELAVDTIRHTLTDSEISPAVKLRAALAVLDRPLFPKPIAPRQEEGQDLPGESPVSVRREPTASRASAEIARNAPCPCGSGVKYKRCCGTNAPPILGQAA